MDIPTQGRIVLYHDTSATWPAIVTRRSLSSADPGQSDPWTERILLDLQVFSAETVFAVRGVRACEPDEDPHMTSGVWTWPTRG